MGDGPYERIDIGGGRTADLYLLRYDKEGRLLSPRAERHLKEALATATDVYCFAHGWNNIFDVALGRYRNFATGFISQRATLAIPAPDPYRPVLVGAIWPSTSFVMPWEAGPDIAAAPDPESPASRELEEMLAFVSESLDADATAELAELVDGRVSLDEAEASRAAEILAPVAQDQDDGPTDGPPPPEAAQLLEAWRSMQEADGPPVRADGGFGGIGGAGGAPRGGPQAAFGFSLDPRQLLRLASVWKMKARAGRVGARGMAPLVRHILSGGAGARLHLIGHSFGAKVLLSALCIEPPERPAHSMLLLQPAINRWCFSSSVPESTWPGGYHSALERVERPIMTTMSRYDSPLHDHFHRALRSEHLGEPEIAGLSDTDLYGALGGYGPAGLGGLSRVQQARAPGQPYDLDAVEVLAIDGGVDIAGTHAIGGHGDISTPVTWWALHSLTSPER